MTCIIGLIDGNEVFMGGDRCEVYGWNQRTLAHPKVFNLNQEFIIGVAGKARVASLLAFGFKPPKQKEKQDNHEFMANDFAEAVRKRLKDGGITEVKDNKEKTDMSILTAYKGKLYHMDNRFYVQLVASNYEAIGVGLEYAMGSLCSSNEKNPSKKILEALEIAERFCLGVRRPFDIKSLKFNGNKKPPRVDRQVKKGK